MKETTQTTNEKIKFDLPLPNGGTVRTYAKMTTVHYFDRENSEENCDITVEYASHKRTFSDCRTQFYGIGLVMDWLKEIKDVDINTVEFLPAEIAK